jgi:YfiR/HmsC-like
METGGKLKFRQWFWLCYCLRWLQEHKRPFVSHRSQFVAAAVACALISPLYIQGQSTRPSEYDVKAAYLYNFSRFVQWPKVEESRNEPFAICVLGQDPFGSSLHSTIMRETIAGRSVVAKQISSLHDALNCQVLFISASEDNRLKQILNNLGTASILTVSDLPRFTQRGGMVQFVLEGNKVRFEVNSATAQRAGLALSSELLKVAVNVRKSVQFGD